MSVEMWTSRLGGRYPKAEIEERHEITIHELDHLRFQGANSICADCGQEGGRTIWSSVNLGVFLCMRCGSLHRALGTHISKPKGCTGSYLWGPDEMANMRRIGNARAAEIYGGADQRPPRDASDAVWLKYLEEKYVQKKFAPKHALHLHGNSHSTSESTEVVHPHNVFQDYLDDHKDSSHRSPSPQQVFHGGTDSPQQHKHTYKVTDAAHASQDFFAQFGM